MRTSEGVELIRRVADEAQISAESAAEDLRRVGSHYSQAGLFAASVALMGAIRGEASEATHGDMPSKVEKLAYHLWRCPPCGIEAPTVGAIQAVMHSIDQIANASSWRMGLEANMHEPVGAPHILSHVQMDVEGIRGSAYPEQIADHIVEIAGKHDSWFRPRLRTSVRDLVDATWAIAAATAVNANRWLEGIPDREIRAFRRGGKRTQVLATALERAEEMLPVSLAGIADLTGTTITEETWDALLGLIGLTAGDAVAAENWLCARSRPLFVLPDRRVLLVGLPHALDRLAESLEQAAKTDQGFFLRFQETKAKWLEREVHEYLARAFGADATYRSMSYQDPDRPGESATAEIDTLVYWPPFLVLVEAKARQFRLEGQLGDINKLRTDLRTNVEDAFYQAKRAQRYIASCDRAVFTEQGSGRSLEVVGRSLRRTYIVTVSVSNLGNAINRMANLRELQLFTDAEYPWAVSRADLQIITSFAEGPDVLLHYLERRREVERQPDRFPINDDLDFFAAYLKTRLHPDRFPKDGVIWLAGWQQRFDQYFEHMRGLRASTPDIRLEVPDIIRDILRELRSRVEDDRARWIAFSLLGLSDRQLANVAGLLEEAKRQAPSAGTYRRTAVTVGDLALSAVVARHVTAAELAERTQRHAILEKYRRRVPKCIGFGFLGSQDAVFDCCIWLDHSWEPDPRLDALLEQEKFLSPAGGQKLPSRNAPCVCGSGRKFKKCCLPKIGARG